MSFNTVFSLDARAVNELVELYQGEWWSRGRTLADVRYMLDNTNLVIGLIREEDGSLAAFSRVLTDEVYWAVLFDVIVHPAHRSKGLGDRLISEVLNHAKVRDVRSVALCCKPELLEFYNRFGFKTESQPDVFWMRRKLPEA